MSYISIICLLRRTLKKMNDFGDFDQEQKKVIWQFAFFVFSFGLKLLVQIIYIIGDDYYNWTTFTYVVIEVVTVYFIGFLPLAYMVMCHHMTYS